MIEICFTIGTILVYRKRNVKTPMLRLNLYSWSEIMSPKAAMFILPILLESPKVASNRLKLRRRKVPE